MIRYIPYYLLEKQRVINVKLSIFTSGWRTNMDFDSYDNVMKGVADSIDAGIFYYCS